MTLLQLRTSCFLCFYCFCIVVTCRPGQSCEWVSQTFLTEFANPHRINAVYIYWPVSSSKLEADNSQLASVDSFMFMNIDKIHYVSIFYESEMQKYDQHYPSTICKVGDVTIFAKYFWQAFEISKTKLLWDILHVLWYQYHAVTVIQWRSDIVSITLNNHCCCYCFFRTLYYGPEIWIKLPNMIFCSNGSKGMTLVWV